MKFAIHLVIVMWVFSSYGEMIQTHSPPWEPVAPGMVLTRNFMVPESPEKDGFKLLPKRYKLGTKAYGKSPPAWWLEIAGKTGVKWHPQDFPLAYAGEFKSKDGRVELLVVQVSQRFSGDGLFLPGTEVWLVAHWFSTGASGIKLLRTEPHSIGSMQYSRLMAGKANGRDIVFEAENGSDFDSRKIANKRASTLTITPDNSTGISVGYWGSP